MADLLANLEGVVCMTNDILVHGQAQEEHDQRLDKVLQRIAEHGLTLNRDKCQFKSEVSWPSYRQRWGPSGLSMCVYIFDLVCV